MHLKKSWNKIGVLHIPMSVDLYDWILSWLTCQDSLGTQLFCSLLWKFWACRNNAIFKGTPMEPIRRAEEVMQFVQNFNEANPPRSVRPHSAVLPVSSPPLLSVFVDA
jgi:hypothetical protein